MSVFRNKIKHLIAIMILLAIIINVMTISSLTFATSMSSTETVSTGQIVDVTAPRGRIKLLNTEVKNGSNYASGTEVEVEIYAKDDKCTDSEIKYYLSTTSISELGEIADESWKSYLLDSNGKCIEKITISGEEVSNICAVFKDATGNTSAIYNGEDTKYEVVYDTGLESQDGSGGGMPAGINTTGYYGMPFVVTSQIPKKEGYSFKGWSTNPNATVGSYGPGSIIPANVFKGAGKTITLNAIFKSDKIVDIENLGEIELSNPDAELNYNPDTGELGGAVPPLGNVPETPPEIPEENLPEIIEFGYGTFESNTEYTPGTYETVEYDVTYTGIKYPVSYNNIVWSKWDVEKDENENIIEIKPGEISLKDIGQYYSAYIVFDFETKKALESNGIKGDSVEICAIYHSSDDTLDNAVYLAAYLRRRRK